MSDGREQYADSAFNKAAEAAMEEYRDKTRFARALGSNEQSIGEAVMKTHAFKDNAPLQQIAIDMAQKGADMTAAARWAPPRNQYEPLFPQGAAIGSPPRPFGGTLTGAGTGGGALGLPPTREEMESVLRKTGWKYPEHTLNAITNPLQEQKRQERDPNGVDPHTPGAKMDAGKTPLRKGALEQFPRALMAVADVSAFGAAKYTWGGWQTVPDGVQRYLDAGARHAALRAMGELIDKDSGLSHLAQEAWNILAALELALRKAHDNI